MVEDLERSLLLKALDRTKGIKKKAAELLHINFRSMRYRLEEYGLITTRILSWVEGIPHCRYQRQPEQSGPSFAGKTRSPIIIFS